MCALTHFVILYWTCVVSRFDTSDHPLLAAIGSTHSPSFSVNWSYLARCWRFPHGWPSRQTILEPNQEEVAEHADMTRPLPWCPLLVVVSHSWGWLRKSEMVALCLQASQSCRVGPSRTWCTGNWSTVSVPIHAAMSADGSRPIGIIYRIQQ